MEFIAGLFYSGELLMTTYRLNLHLITASGENEDHNVALDRVRYFIHKQLEHSVFVNAGDTQACSRLHDAGIRLTTLPDEPVDQIIGIMLYLKLNAIMEGKMLVTELELSSDVGSNVIYLHDNEENLGPLTAAGWWHESDLRHGHEIIDTDKVMSMNRNSTWRDLGLNWSRPDEDTTGNTIVFADFGRDEKK